MGQKPKIDSLRIHDAAKAALRCAIDEACGIAKPIASDPVLIDYFAARDEAHANAVNQAMDEHDREIRNGV